MPTYDYECSACSHKYEIFEKVHDESVKACPKCGKKKARRLLGIGAGVIFKGSGFYVTDNKKGGSAAPPAPKSDSKSETKSEAKSEPKGESKSEPAPKKSDRKEPKKN